ncbi:MAG: hypothetical protein HY822_01590 [Acidobacteria bacterium]|nr:hypothetical protein [Acidobacteriota bacterium]
MAGQARELARRCHEPVIRCHQWDLTLKGQRKVDAIVNWVAHLESQLKGVVQQRTALRQGHGRLEEQLETGTRIHLGEIPCQRLFFQYVRALDRKQVGCFQPRQSSLVSHFALQFSAVGMLAG